MFYLHKTPGLFKRLFPGITWDGSHGSSSKEIFLTFDDGPTDTTSRAILDILEKYDVKATFFCVGENIQRHADIVEELLSRGHVIGNHGHTHKNGWYCSAREYVKDVELCRQVLEEAGINGKIFRPPYGKLKPKQYKLLKEKGFEVVMWDVLSGDFDKRVSGSDILRKSVRHTRPGTIIVFHDNIKSKEVVLEVLPLYIEHFLKEGYSFKKIWI